MKNSLLFEFSNLTIGEFLEHANAWVRSTIQEEVKLAIRSALLIIINGPTSINVSVLLDELDTIFVEAVMFINYVIFDIRCCRLAKRYLRFR
jgi:hypothetical protein